VNVIISRLFFLACLVLSSACASHKPIVYPNAHSKAVATAQIERDIVGCKALVESAGASSSNSKATNLAKQTARSGGVGAATGAVGGPIAGRAGPDAAIGAA